MKPKAKSRILGNILEGANDLYQVGAISEQRMRRYERMCLKGSPRAKSKPAAKRISVSKSVRDALSKASHAVRRSMIPVSPNDAAALLAVLGKARAEPVLDSQLAVRA